ALAARVRRVPQILDDHARRVRGDGGLFVPEVRKARVRLAPPRSERGFTDELAAGLRMERADLRRRVRGVVGVERHEGVDVVSVEGAHPRAPDAEILVMHGADYRRKVPRSTYE